MSIDIHVGIRLRNVPTENNYANDLCVEGQKGCELIISFVVNKSLSYIWTVSATRVHYKPKQTFTFVWQWPKFTHTPTTTIVNTLTMKQLPGGYMHF